MSDNGGKNGKKKMAMAVLSGDLDKLFGAFIIATSAAASNMDVTMFFTFWGLRAIKKNEKTGKSFMGKMMGLMEGGDINKADPSKYSMWGMGRWMFKKMMRNKKVASLPELRQMALDLGVKFYGCQMSMDVMDIPREKLIDEVEDCVGGGFFVEKAIEADAQFFI
ncbi:MAG: DsrE/DsrF/DrsH-like family protein [Candidatus Humimicrobiaceae bacterium]